MKIGGFQKFSLIDYPGKISAVIFTRGCNFRCSFCHNPELVLPEHYHHVVPEEEVFSVLRKRVNHLEGIVISGGEPAMHDDLPEFIGRIKDLGFLVKLDTNGSYPKMLKKLLDARLVDYVSMDIKAPLSKYDKVTGTLVKLADIQESIDLLRQSDVEVAFRTTMVKKFLNFGDIKEIQYMLGKDNVYILQYFNPNDKLINTDLATEPNYTQTEIASFQKRLYDETFP